MILFEFFDYNCPFCRKASKDISGILGRDRNLRLALVNNAVPSIGSIEAAKAQQGVLKLRGPVVAWKFHERLLARRGLVGGALTVARELGIETGALTDAANSEIVGKVLARQASLARDIGFSTTPSFAVHGVGILGWPGSRALRDIAASIRRCDQPACG